MNVRKKIRNTMRNITSLMKLSFIAILALAHCSCVSTAIDRATNKHRKILSKGHSRSDIRKQVGDPEMTWEKSSKKKPAYAVRNFSAYDVFKVRGVVARPGDGAAQATANAVSLGMSEAISLPITLAGVAAKPFTVQRLVVFYDHDLMYGSHQIFDNKGGKVESSGY